MIEVGVKQWGGMRKFFNYNNICFKAYENGVVLGRTFRRH